MSDEHVKKRRYNLYGGKCLQPEQMELMESDTYIAFIASSVKRSLL